MAGPWRHPESGIWYFRRATPSDLLKRKSELNAIGIKTKSIFQRSLRTRDQSLAKRLYPAVNAEVESLWTAWRDALRNGPERLTFKQLTALAGEHAQNFLLAHEDEPFDAPQEANSDALRFPDDTPMHHTRAALRGMSRKNQLEFRSALQTFIGSSLNGKLSDAIAFLKMHPFFAKDTIPQFEQLLETLHGGDTESILLRKGITVDQVSRGGLNLELLQWIGTARRGLEQRQSGDYGGIEAFSKLPEFTTHPTTIIHQSFSAIIDRQEEISEQSLKGQTKASSTFKKYRIDCQQFATFRGSDNALSVTLEEGEAWRDSLMSKRLTAKTVHNKCGSVQSVLGWAKKHSKGQLLVVNPFAYLDTPEPQANDQQVRSYTLPQAQAVLRAARLETEPRYRWVPWVLAYTGMRIDEVGQLCKDDIEQVDGHWVFRIRVGNGRTTKNRTARSVPMLQPLIEEGFLAFIRSQDDGQLFPRSNLSQAMARWRKRKVPGVDHTWPDPSHGFRHMFKDRVSGILTESERNYVLGWVESGSARSYGGGPEAQIEIARKLEKLEGIL